MPAPTEQHSGEYISLKEYIDTCLEARDKATEVAYENMQHRLDGMNEFRQSLRDQNQTFLAKTEYCVWKETVDADIRTLRESRAELAGKADQKRVNTYMIITIISLLLGIASFIKGLVP